VIVNEFGIVESDGHDDEGDLQVDLDELGYDPVAV
jgi:hypothetical protein